MIEKAELISYGVFFAIAIFMTWSSRVDPNTYYHLAFSVLSVWIIIVSIVQGVISQKTEWRFLLVSLSLGLSQLASACFAAYFCQELLVVPALCITLIGIGQPTSLQLASAKFILALFICIAAQMPAQVKAAAMLTTIDFFLHLIKLGYRWYDSRKKLGRQRSTKK